MKVKAKTDTSTQPMPCQKVQTSAAIEPPTISGERDVGIAKFGFDQRTFDHHARRQFAVRAFRHHALD